MEDNSDVQPSYKTLFGDAKVRAVLLVTVLFSIALIFTVDGFNGPSYWIWSWRRLPFIRIFIFLAAAMVPFALSQWLHHVKHKRCWALFLLCVSCLSLQLAAVGTSRRTETFTLSRLHDYVLLRKHTGYFQDADTFASSDNWFADYPKIISSSAVGPHSHNKPPGPILFFVVLRKLIPDVASAAYAAGLIIGILGALSVAAVYVLLQRLTGDQDAAYGGASYYSLCPGLVLFLPQFDQAFPILSCLIIGAWWQALHSEKRRYFWAVGCGLILAISLFISYNFMVLGIMMSILGLWAWQTEKLSLSHGAKVSASVIGTVVAGYLLFFLATGYNPIRTFMVCYQNQSELAHGLGRPWPQCLPWDLYDFALGSAWISYLLVLYYGISHFKPGISTAAQVALICLAQIGITAITGLLRTETARVWIFMLPFLMVPIGLELKNWKPLPRAMVYTCAWFLLLLIHRHMWFMRG